VVVGAFVGTGAKVGAGVNNVFVAIGTVGTGTDDALIGTEAEVGVGANEALVGTGAEVGTDIVVAQAARKRANPNAAKTTRLLFTV